MSSVHDHAHGFYSVKDIWVECSSEDGMTSDLDSVLTLTVMDLAEPRSLKLGRTSPARWIRKDINKDCIFVSPDSEVLIVVSSPELGDLGCVTLDGNCCSEASRHMEARESSLPEAHLKLDLESEEFPSLVICLDVEPSTLQNIIDNKSNVYVNSLAIHEVIQSLSEDDVLKVDGLHFCGLQSGKIFARSQKEDDIRAAIEAFQDAAGRLTPDDIRFAAYRNDVGLAYKKCYEITKKLEDIGAAVSIGRQTVAAMPEGHSLIPPLLFNLAGWLSDRFKATGNPAEISEAIEVLQRSVDLTSEGDPDLIERLNNLGNAFLRRFELTGDLEDISGSIEKHRQAIRLAPDTFEDLSDMLSNLGNSLSLRFGRTGNLSDVSEAVLVGEKGLRLAPEGHPSLPGYLTNLGISYSLRFQAAGDTMDISESIKLQQRALQIMPDDNPMYLAATLTNLAKSLLMRFTHTGNITDISEAIEAQQRARQLTPDGHPELPSQLNNLGTLITARFERMHDLADIFEAIRVQQQAVALAPEGHASLPGFLGNLARSFFRRFERTGSLSDISTTITTLQRAVKLVPEGHPYYSEWIHELGISFLCRFQITSQGADIQQAVELMQKAFKLTPEGHPERSIRLNNLGRLYHFCFERSGEVKLFKFAVSAFREAAESSTGPPYVFLLAAKQWAALSRSRFGSRSELLEAHEHIIHLLSFNAGLENTFRRRHEVLLDSSQLSTRAAAAALSVDQLDKAVEWLEQGRCIVWNQINQLRSPLDDLRDYDPALADRLGLLSRQLESASSRSESQSSSMLSTPGGKFSVEEEAHNHLKIARERDELLKSIRALPSFENFLQPKKFADLMRDLPTEGPVVIINADKDRCDALALMADCDEPIHIPLERFSYDKAMHLAEGLRGYLSSRRLRTRYAGLNEALTDEGRGTKRLGHRPSADVSPKQLLADLWTDLVEPILQTLAIQLPDDSEDLPRIWWCPTGPFAFLPIHAAGIYYEAQNSRGFCLADYAVSSYTATLSILTRLRSRPEPSSESESKKGVLLVSQPDTPGLSPIPCTVEEVQATQEQLNKHSIQSALFTSQNATTLAISSAMESFSCIHLACHASQEITNPLESAIHLHDGPLMLSEIMKKDLPYADFAFMSACQTSAGDDKLPEEAVHLAAGMLAAGYRSVVATMWSISDEHAPGVAEMFYRNLLEDSQGGLDGRYAAKALHAAMQHLRDQLGSSTEALLAWIPYIHVGV